MRIGDMTRRSQIVCSCGLLRIFPRAPKYASHTSTGRCPLCLRSEFSGKTASALAAVTTTSQAKKTMTLTMSTTTRTTLRTTPRKTRTTITTTTTTTTTIVPFTTPLKKEKATRKASLPKTTTDQKETTRPHESYAKAAAQMDLLASTKYFPIHTFPEVWSGRHLCKCHQSRTKRSQRRRCCLWNRRHRDSSHRTLRSHRNQKHCSNQNNQSHQDNQIQCGLCLPHNDRNQKKHQHTHNNNRGHKLTGDGPR